jgi:outer membrane protein
MGGKLRIFIALAVLLVPVTAFAEGKIGIINFDDALKNSRAGKAAFAQLQSRFDSREKALAAQGADLKKMQNDLQQTGVALSKDAKSKKAAEFEDKARRFFEEQRKLQQDEQQAQQSVLEPLFKRMVQVINGYASKHGYSVILEIRNAVYYDPKLDVTKDIQQEFDKGK